MTGNSREASKGKPMTATVKDNDLSVDENGPKGALKEKPKGPASGYGKEFPADISNHERVGPEEESREAQIDNDDSSNSRKSGL